MTFQKERIVLIRMIMCVAVITGAQRCLPEDVSGVDAAAAFAAQRVLPAPIRHDIAAGVYAALVSGAGYHGIQAAGMLVKDEWISIDPVSDSAVPEWLAELAPLPAELRQALRRPPVFEAAVFNRSLFPAGTRFISPKVIDAVFSRSGPDGWPEFRRQHKAAGFVAYSQVLATSDGLDALVYVEASCGGLCGEGVYHWLHRARPGSPWSIMKSITSWIA